MHEPSRVTAYSAGEVSKKFHARTDFPAFSKGVAVAENVFVEVTGGLSNRSGLEYLIEFPDKDTRIFPMSTLGDDLVVVFRPNKVFFVQDGQFQMDGDPAEATVALGLYTLVDHGLEVGDFVQVSKDSYSGYAYVTEVHDDDTFVLNLGDFEGTVEVWRCFWAESGIPAEQLEGLNFAQDQNSLIITSLTFPRHMLYILNGVWTVIRMDGASQFVVPSTPKGGASKSGGSEHKMNVGYAVTAVIDGVETAPSDMLKLANIVDISLDAEDWVNIYWTPTAGAEYYNVYRTNFQRDYAIDDNAQLGYIGRTVAPRFQDRNITADFTKGVPFNKSPFVSGTISSVEVLSSGDGYVNNQLIDVIDDTGVGAVLRTRVATGGAIIAIRIPLGGTANPFFGKRVFTISDPTGAGAVIEAKYVRVTQLQGDREVTVNKLTGIIVKNGGDNYSNPVLLSDGNPVAGASIIYETDGKLADITVVSGGSGYSDPELVFEDGTGAQYKINIAQDVSPRLYVRHQQRGVYAGTISNPKTVWGSVPRNNNLFRESSPLAPDDSYIHEIDSNDVQPILHMLSIRHGLLLFTRKDITMLRGKEYESITPTSAYAEPQTALGAASTNPLLINYDVLFLSAQSTSVYALMYTDYLESFRLQDISILSSHMFSEDRPFRRAGWLPTPNKLVQFVREDGEIVNLTYDREQEVAGWTRYKTQGRYIDMAPVLEGNFTVGYYMTERKLRGGYRYLLERERPRRTTLLDQLWFLDCAMATDAKRPDTRLQLTKLEDQDEVLLEAWSSVFEGVEVGDCIIAFGGRYVVTSLVGEKAVQAREELPPNKYVHASAPERIDYADPLRWAIYKRRTYVDGLWHLEGELVSVYQDGYTYENQLVSGGRLELQRPGHIIVVGLPYHSTIKTLQSSSRQAITDGKERQVRAMRIRMCDARGLEVGQELDKLEPLRGRGIQSQTGANKMRDDWAQVEQTTTMMQEDAVYIVQKYPLPFTLLAHNLDVDYTE